MSIHARDQTTTGQTGRRETKKKEEKKQTTSLVPMVVCSARAPNTTPKPQTTNNVFLLSSLTTTRRFPPFPILNRAPARAHRASAGPAQQRTAHNSDACSFPLYRYRAPERTLSPSLGQPPSRRLQQQDRGDGGARILTDYITKKTPTSPHQSVHTSTTHASNRARIISHVD